MFSWDPKSPQHQDTCNFWMFGPWSHLRNHLRPFFVYTWDPAGGTGLSRFCDISRCRLVSVTWLDSARPQKHNDTMQADFLCIRSLQFYQVDPAQAYWRKVRKACIFVVSLVLSSINANECLRKPLRTMWDFKIYNLKYISLNILKTFGKTQAPNHWEKPCNKWGSCHPIRSWWTQVSSRLCRGGGAGGSFADARSDGANAAEPGTTWHRCGYLWVVWHGSPSCWGHFCCFILKKHDWCCITTRPLEF